ncbi:MAG: enoyl-CoA hydratase/isomerase family protein [Acidimicrobiales bacterium]|jgi:enoyl-CoA hydratase/carnithine racemase|nr:enoyl-CoA hydratase/isomerase family protein [Acidimicrobiales bacterium]
MPDFTCLSLDVDGPVARLTLRRPDRLNALSPTLLRELVEAARHLDDAREVKVVVVRGQGRAFCAGFDLGAFADPVDDPRTVADLGRRMAEAIGTTRPLTIAAVHGHCVGGGLVLAASCDLRLASDDAVFSIPEADLGIPLAWGGIPRLVREIGPAATTELVLTCRPFDADEARRLGLLNRVVPSDRIDGEAEALAAVLADRAAVVLETTKRQVHAATEALASTAGAGVDATLLVASLADPEARATALAYLEARSRRAGGVGGVGGQPPSGSS